ncbi:hypothetical protein V6N11_014144 [Hibiscus sabdariffa]|uniref:Uncharacterized protein n=1 Tax=Hibiscus sabdariffa TaxID=183260 RepID=A0ABR2AFQ6_9ROSI
MISARAAGRTTIVSLVTTRVELSQKVWYSSLSERASGISLTAHQNNFLDRARDAHSLKFKSGLSPLQHFYYFLASPFSGISLFSFQIILHTFAAFFIMLFYPSGMFGRCPGLLKNLSDKNAA